MYVHNHTPACGSTSQSLMYQSWPVLWVKTNHCMYAAALKRICSLLQKTNKLSNNFPSQISPPPYSYTLISHAPPPPPPHHHLLQSVSRFKPASSSSSSDIIIIQHTQFINKPSKFHVEKDAHTKIGSLANQAWGFLANQARSKLQFTKGEKRLAGRGGRNRGRAEGGVTEMGGA